VADEATTQPDSKNSTTTSEAPTEQQGTSDTQAVEAGSDVAATADEQGSILGGALEPQAEAAADPEPEAPVVPEKYELTLEGVELDADSLAVAEPVFKELGLSNDQANKLMPVAKQFSERIADQTLQSIVDAGRVQKAQWADAAKADPEIGGAKFQETTHLAAKALDALGFPEGSEFRKALTETGFGNHPDMIRAMRKIGEMIGEDGFVRSDAGGSSKPKPLHEKLATPVAKGV